MSEARICGEIALIEEDGSPSAAGFNFNLGKLKNEMTYEELTENLDIPALLKMCGLDGIIEPSDFRLITPEEYDSKYENGGDEGITCSIPCEGVEE